MTDKVKRYNFKESYSIHRKMFILTITCTQYLNMQNCLERGCKNII